MLSFFIHVPIILYYTMSFFINFINVKCWIRQNQPGLSFFLMAKKLYTESANNWNWLKVINVSDKKAVYCCAVIN